VVEILENCAIRGKNKIPATLSQAQLNIVLAIDCIENNKPGKLPGCYLNYEKVSEKILRGDRDVIWGLLSTIRELYPQTEQQNKIPLHLLDTGLPYSLPEIVNLEKSIINWLVNLHLIIKNDQEISLLDIEKRIRNGTLLCDLAAILHKNKQKVHGVISDPKSAATALANIRKAFELLRKLNKINRRYLWAEKEILNGDRGVILGLLEDLHKFYDGILEYKLGTGPYLSKFDQQKSTISEIMPNEFNSIDNEHFTKLDTESGKEPEFESSLGNPRIDSYEMPITPSAPIPYPCPENPTKSAIKPTKRDNEPTHKKSPSYDVNYNNTNNYSQEFTENTRNKSISQISNQQNLTNRITNMPINSEQTILEWMKKLGVPYIKENPLLLEGQILEKIKNGVIIAKLIEILERKKIEGINENPKSSASSLHNIKKSLEMIKGKKSIPVKYLYSDIEIHQGQKDVILGFLNSLKNAYPSVFPSPIKYFSIKKFI